MAKRKATAKAGPAGAVVEKWLVETINAAPYNPRKNLRRDDPAYQAIKRSIEEFGYVDLLVVNRRTKHLVGGHQRFKIIRDDLRWRELDVSVVDLDDRAEKRLNLALNKVGGEWDDDLLTALLRELTADGEDMAPTGFSDDDLAALLDDGKPESKQTDAQLGQYEYFVEIACKDEKDQKRVLTLLEKQKIRCKARIS